MRSGKFFNILQTLDKKERKGFRTFLESPYPASNLLLLRLYDLIAAVPPDEVPNRQVLWKELYAEKTEAPAYRDDHMRKHLSDLALLAEQFIAFEHVRANPARQDSVLLEFYRERGLDKYFKQLLRQSQQSQDKREQELGGMGYWYSFEREMQHYYWEVSRTRNPKSLPLLSPPLDKAYLHFQLHILLERRIKQQLKTSENAPDRETIILELANRPEYQAHPYVRSHLLLLELMDADKNAPEHLERIRTTLNAMMRLATNQNRSRLSYPLSALLNYLINLSANRQGEERSFLMDRIIILYDFLFINRYLWEEGYLNQFHYKNFNSLLIMNGEMERAQKVIDQYRPQLKPDIRDSVYSFVSAYLYYQMGEYAKALLALQNVDSDDDYYTLDARSLRMMIFLDRGDYDLLESFLETFKRYLTRNKTIPAQRRRKHINRLGYIRKFFKIISRAEIEMSKLADLRKKVVEEKDLLNREYLLNKIDSHLNK